MNIGHCYGCRHWQPFTDRISRGDASNARKLGLCGKVKCDHDVATRDNANFYATGPDEADPPLEAGHIALVEDLSGCAGLRTAAEFGCLLFEPKPPVFTYWGPDK